MIEDYSINEVSEQLNMSFERTRQLIGDESGILRFPPGINERPTSERPVYRRLN
jgi:hypothetical protein